VAIPAATKRIRSVRVPMPSMPLMPSLRLHLSGLDAAVLDG
jgi:hypothetical protein